jgi:predicted MPP superfamily phosphohydrolase
MVHGTLLFLGIWGAIAGISLAFIAQRYWFARAWRSAGRIPRRGWRKVARIGILFVLAAIALGAIAGIVRNLRTTVSPGSWWTAFFGLWLSSSILAYLFIKMIAGMEWLWIRVRSARAAKIPPVSLIADTTGDIDHSRRNFFQAAGFLAGTIPFVSFTYGFMQERFGFRIQEVDIPIANLPRELEGMRIAQLSDIHIGAYMPVGQVRRAVGMANELGSDLTVVTGDFLTARPDPLEDCIKELSHLRAPLGVWGCNGNHEIYAGAEQTAQTLFQQFGMKLLRSENTELNFQGGKFNLIGVDYQRQRNKQGDPVPMLAGVDTLVRRDIPNILLSHNPNSFPRAAELGIELSLAGHTHGGQVRVEVLDDSWNPARFLTPYIAGLYQRPLNFSSALSEKELSALFPESSLRSVPASKIYVNRGLGTIGAPVRLGVPPEITLITLRRA